MNIFHDFCESLCKRTVREEKLRGIFVFLYIFLFHINHFICIQIFNNCCKKFTKKTFVSAQKDATRCRNERTNQIIMNERSD